MIDDRHVAANTARFIRADGDQILRSVGNQCAIVDATDAGHRLRSNVENAKGRPRRPGEPMALRLEGQTKQGWRAGVALDRVRWSAIKAVPNVNRAVVVAVAFCRERVVAGEGDRHLSAAWVGRRELHRGRGEDDIDRREAIADDKSECAAHCSVFQRSDSRIHSDNVWRRGGVGLPEQQHPRRSAVDMRPANRAVRHEPVRAVGCRSSRSERRVAVDHCGIISDYSNEWYSADRAH